MSSKSNLILDESRDFPHRTSDIPGVAIAGKSVAGPVYRNGSDCVSISIANRCRHPVYLEVKVAHRPDIAVAPGSRQFCFEPFLGGDRFGREPLQAEIGKLLDGWVGPGHQEREAAGNSVERKTGPRPISGSHRAIRRHVVDVEGGSTVGNREPRALAKIVGQLSEVRPRYLSQCSNRDSLFSKCHEGGSDDIATCRVNAIHCSYLFESREQTRDGALGESRRSGYLGDPGASLGGIYRAKGGKYSLNRLHQSRDLTERNVPLGRTAEVR